MGLGPSGDKLFDTSGNDNHGTLTNMDPATDWVVDGDGYALDFDGDDDFIDLGTITTSNPLQLNGPATISAWVKWDGTGDPFQRIIDKSNGGNGQNGWALHIEAADSSVWLQLNNQSTNSAISSVSAGAWASITGIVYGGAVNNEIYIDGTETSSYQSQTSGVANSVQTNARIGTWNHSTGREFNGLIDDVRIYNRALSPNEIAILARRRNIAYERKPLTVFFPVAATGNRRRRALIGS